MFGLGPLEIVLLLVMVLVIFGAGKLPEIGSGMGSAIKNFKKSIRESNEIDVTPSNGKKKIDEGEKGK